MLEAYFIYSSLLLLLLFFVSVRLKKYPNLSAYLVIIFASIVLGLRYDVGIDYLSYKSFFVHQDFSKVEWGYALLNQILYFLRLPYPCLFILVAFLQLFFFYEGIKRYPKIIPYAIYFYFTTVYIFFSLNGLRQAMAFSLFVYAVNFIYTKKLLKFLIVMFVASSFHKSSLILAVFYFFINREIFKSVKLQFILYFVTFFAGQLIQQLIWDNFAIIASVVGYDDMNRGIETLKGVKWAKEGGLGYLLWMFINCWVILYSKRMLKKFNNSPIQIFYNLYFIGVLISNCVQGTYLDRMNVYFMNMRIIIYSFFLCYIFRYNKNKYNKILGYVMMFALLLFFYVGIKNGASKCSPFQFVFSL